MSNAEAPKLPWYPWYVRDYLADTILLDDIADLIYRRLLDYQWIAGSIPSDPLVRARVARVTPRQMTKHWPAVAQFFPAGDDSVLQNRRMERIREEQIRKAIRRSDASSRVWGQATTDAERFVYAIRREVDGIIKIGWSRNPAKRAETLAREWSSPMTLLAFAPGGFKLERQAQIDLASDRVGSEWFNPTPAVHTWIDVYLKPEPVNHGTDRGKPRITAIEAETEPEPDTSTTPAGLSERVGRDAPTFALDFAAAFRASHSPDGLRRDIEALHSGMHGPGGKVVPLPIIGQALRDIAQRGITPTSKVLAGFCAALMRPAKATEDQSRKDKWAQAIEGVPDAA